MKIHCIRVKFTYYLYIINNRRFVVRKMSSAKYFMIHALKIVRSKIFSLKFFSFDFALKIVCVFIYDVNFKIVITNCYKMVFILNA